MLEGELDDHLGYKNHEKSIADNSRKSEQVWESLKS